MSSDFCSNSVLLMKNTHPRCAPWMSCAARKRDHLVDARWMRPTARTACNNPAHGTALCPILFCLTLRHLRIVLSPASFVERILLHVEHRVLSTVQGVS